MPLQTTNTSFFCVRSYHFRDTKQKRRRKIMQLVKKQVSTSKEVKTITRNSVKMCIIIIDEHISAYNIYQSENNLTGDRYEHISCFMLQLIKLNYGSSISFEMKQTAKYKHHSV